MKRTLLPALCSALILATPAVAQQIEILQPARVVSAAQSPATLEMLDTIRAVADTRGVFSLTNPPTVNPIVQAFQQAPRPAAPAQPAAPAPPGTAPAPPVQPFPPSPPSSRRPRNVRFDITITDIGGPKPVTKVVSLTVSDNGGSGSIRNMARMPGAPYAFQAGPDSPVPAPVPGSGPGSFPLNVDVRAVTPDDAGVRATVIIEYQPYVPDAKIQPGVINASSMALFVDGARTQILQASDPLTDRRTTIEVTATILK